MRPLKHHERDLGENCHFEYFSLVAVKSSLTNTLTLVSPWNSAASNVSEVYSEVRRRLYGEATASVAQVGGQVRRQLRE